MFTEIYLNRLNYRNSSVFHVTYIYTTNAAFFQSWLREEIPVESNLFPKPAVDRRSIGKILFVVSVAVDV
nr:MAG TPA: hypothetical protein [Inoviridae sp.]